MQLKFNKRTIADNCTYIAYILILIIGFLAILGIADFIFRWDILSKNLERLAYLFIWANVVVIFSSFLISMMVNMSIMSESMEKIADNLSKPTKIANKND